MKFDVDNPREKDLSMFQRLQLQMNGTVAVGNYTRPGWKGYLTFYAFRCKTHGLVCTYVSGEDNLSCPRCLEEIKKEYGLKP